MTDFDTLLMQDMDATVKDLEPLIGGRNAAEATDAVAFLEQGLEWTEQYFLSKGVADGAKLARDGKQRAQAARAALAANDFGSGDAGRARRREVVPRLPRRLSALSEPADRGQPRCNRNVPALRLT